MSDNIRKCLFAGSFDPPTLGHKAIINDCLQLFDEVIVAIMVNNHKKPFFSYEERVEMIKLMFPNFKNIKIIHFEGTVAELLEREKTPFYVRGIRNTVDFEYENSDYFATRKLNDKIIPVYFPCRQELLHISSSIVKNSLLFGTPINEYVTKEVEDYIKENMKKKSVSI